MTDVRKGQAPPQLSRAAFRKRFREAFYDPAFRAADDAIDRLEAIAWEGYEQDRKAPLTSPAGPGFADPGYKLSVEWRATSERLKAAQAHQQDPATRSRVLLVCADGGNPDPTATGGKDPAKAKALELAGWPYPKHLAGRVYGVAVHGDVSGVESVRRALCDWLDWMGLVDAGAMARLDRFIGYYRPYATSHEELDRDLEVQEEVRNVARAVANGVRELRAGTLGAPDAGLVPPRPK